MQIYVKCTFIIPTTLETLRPCVRVCRLNDFVSPDIVIAHYRKVNKYRR